MNKSIKIAKEVFEIELKELEKIKGRIDDNFERLCRIIINSKGKVVLTGVGKSGLIAQKIAATLSSTGTTSIFMHSTEGLHGDLGMITKDDVVITISNSGRSDEVLSIMPSIEKIGAQIIVMTGDIKSPLAEFSNIIIDIGVEQEACPMNLAPTSSTTATLVMGDAIAAALIELKQFKPENFGLFHPGGSLGRRLLTKVADVMHKGNSLPITFPTSKIDDVLIEMTQKQLGAVCVIDDNFLLKGIITEGDVRRALSFKEKFFTFCASDIMTTNPISISPNDMAIDALSTMENRENQISVLPVIENKKLVGLIRVHDLLLVK